MKTYIDKSALVTEIERLQDTTIENGHFRSQYYEGIFDGLSSLERFIDTLEVKEVDESLAKVYLQVFDKKFPILLTLKGKQLDKFKNFLNRCQQIFDLQEWGIHPIQAKLFEKLTLLWAAWGAEHLQGIGNANGEFDRCGLTWQDIKDIAEIGNDFMNSEESDNLNEEDYYTGILKRFLGKKGGEKL